MLRRFLFDTSANIGVIFGLTIVPMVAASGAALDYSRASNMRSAHQSAADAAALAGAKVRMISKSSQLADAEANRVFAANLRAIGVTDAPKPTVTVLADGVKVEGQNAQKTTMMNFFGFKTLDIAYSSQAMEAAPGTVGITGDEIALVLDNTGSMSNDMATLRSAASSFVDKAMDGVTKVSVVPFVTAVNVGSRNLSNGHLDRLSQSKWHGIFTRNPTDRQSVQNYNGGRAMYVAEGACNYSSGGGGSGGPGKGGKGVFLAPGQWNLDDHLKTIFGISTAHAQSAITTPNTIPPLAGRTIPKGSTAKVPGTIFVPDGFRNSYFDCHLEPPTKVNHFDLLDRMPGARWKGCVEARPEPFDVTDDPPSQGNADSLYTPYFWPDEHDPADISRPTAQNNYLSDGTPPAGWWHNDRTANILKYNGSSRPNIIETAPDTLGPNKACPSELQRLTPEKNIVRNAINNMQHWNGGGTILVEGLAWGWRTLSPNAPLADGKPYSKEAKKTIIFMSDGENELGESGTDFYSQYSSYGFLASGRFPVSTFQDAHKYLDDRFLLACDNAKAKGIRIITILFRSAQTRGVDLMKRCASTSSDAYVSGTQGNLLATFDRIAGQFEGTNSRLRLVK